MKLSKLSASSFKKHCACPHAFFIQQNLKWMFPAGKAADRGTIVHRVLEILAEQKLARQKSQSFFSTNETGEVATAENIPIDQLTQDVYDYQTKEVMPHHEWDQKDFNECMLYVNTALSHGEGRFNPLNRKIINTEQYIKIAPQDDWAILPDGKKLNITGFIDLVTDEGNDIIEIIDWKTGRQVDWNTGEELNEETLKNDIQLKMYHYAATRMYGEDKTFLVTIFFLKTKTPITIHFSQEDVEDTKNRIREKMNEILADSFPRRNITWKCRKFCEYGKNTFEGSNIVPEIQVLGDGIASEGNIMTICDQVNMELSFKGLEWVEENMVAQ